MRFTTPLAYESPIRRSLRCRCCGCWPRRTSELRYMLPNFSYVRPNSLSEAVREVASGGTIHAGGTDLLGCLRDGVFTSNKLVSLQSLDGLRGIRQTESG